MSDFMDFVKQVMPLNRERKKKIDDLRKFVTLEHYEPAKKLFKQKKIDISFSRAGYTVIDDIEFPEIIAISKEHFVEHFVSEISKSIRTKLNKISFKELSKTPDKIKRFIAPNIEGFEDTKEAVTLQLFSKEQFHILLIGDPGTGKTEILRYAAELAPISSYGLGSGTSGVGLAVTVSKKEVNKGLLPMADKGLCCIDELNLMKKEDYASLYNAMEKGFVSYDKKGFHYKFDARINVLATANPKGDKFKSTAIGKIKKQLPFDSALLTRFHLLFLVKSPGIEKFKKIVSKIVSNEKLEINDADKNLIKDYIVYSLQKEVNFPSDLEKHVVKFAEEIKKKEKNFIIDISPRVIIGVIRLAKARARIYLRDEVTLQDLKKVEDIIRNCLHVDKAKAKTI